MSVNARNGSSNLEMAQSNQDLLNAKGTRKKRTWFIIGVVGAIVVGLLIISIILLSTENDEHKDPDEKTPLALEDLLSGALYPSSFNATWVSGNELLYKDGNSNLVIKNLDKQNDSTRLILPSTDPLMATSFSFKISSDKKYLLISHEYQKLYRYSHRARHTIIDLQTGGRTPLTIGANLDLQLVKWAPTGNALVIVFQNNIYYKKEAFQDPVAITKDTGFITNGVPDWVYEEEVLNSNEALEFSPDGQMIAFARFNDSHTPTMVLPIYGEPSNPYFQYPKSNFIKYPKAGAPNPFVSFHLVDLSAPAVVRELESPDYLNSTNSILTTFTWANNTTLAAIWMNRVQNEASIVTYTSNNIVPKQIVHLKERAGWLELFSPPVFNKDGSQMAIIISQDQGKLLGGFRHLVIFNTTENAAPVALTRGAYIVNSIISWNSESNVIYYLANTEKDPGVQHVYEVSLITKEISCLSCDIKSPSGKPCLYNSATFNSNFTYYVLECNGPDVPSTYIYRIDKKLKLVWDTNENLRNMTLSRKVPVKKRMTFDVAGGMKAQVSLLIPSDLDEDERYPMLVNVYGGPDSSQVTEKFEMDWGSYLASNKKIIIAAIDGRGSGLKGDKMLFAGYRHLGSVEVADQINVTKQIQQTVKYVDSKRTAIWGWSYGGYASAMALATDKEGIFKCAISVAPVTDWLLYDSIYTERFMGLPTLQDNLKGYFESQLLTKYEGIRDKPYFLIHGTLDDNVHYQQSMLWSKVLEKHDILFRQQSYPDEDHGLASVRPHLYHSLETFLNECLVPDLD